jgi:hypothetical protein
MRRPSAATAIAGAALFVALGGPAQATRLISGKDIAAGTVTSKQVKDRSLKPRDLSRRAVRALTVTPDGSVAASKLADGAVTTRALAPGSVLTGSVGDASIGAADLAPSSVGTEEVAENAVGQAEIRNNGVGASEIADQSIDAGEVVDGGLQARDVGRFHGSLIVNFSNLPSGTCQAAAVTGTAADLANADISNDLIVIAPGDGWDEHLTYGVSSAEIDDQFLLYACNPSNGDVDPPAVTFRYVIIGFG